VFSPRRWHTQRSCPLTLPAGSLRSVGKTFGQVGAYEALRGTVHYAIDPRSASVRDIADIRYAPVSSLQGAGQEYGADTEPVRLPNLWMMRRILLSAEEERPVKRDNPRGAPEAPCWSATAAHSV